MKRDKSFSIRESGMEFIPIHPDDVFYIEKSGAYASLSSGFSAVEFAYINPKKALVFVEAKQSSPRPTIENEVRFSEFIDEIAAKFIDSYELFLTTYLERRANDEVGIHIRQATMRVLSIKFILVIRGHKIDWLLPISDALKKKMRKPLRMWNIDIAVINDETAKKYGMIA